MNLLHVNRALSENVSSYIFNQVNVDKLYFPFPLYAYRRLCVVGVWGGGVDVNLHLYFCNPTALVYVGPWAAIGGGNLSGGLSIFSL